MRSVGGALSLVVAVFVCAEASAPGAKQSRQPTTAERSTTFAADVRPILEHDCRPCHFEGGTMYAKLPFDQPATIVKLGTRLFTRIKDESKRAPIRKFLAEQQGAPHDGHSQ